MGKKRLKKSKVEAQPQLWRLLSLFQLKRMRGSTGE